MKTQYRKVAVAVAAALAAIREPGVQPPRGAEHHPHARRGCDRLLPLQQLRARPCRLRDRARELRAAAGSLWRSQLLRPRPGALYEILIDNNGDAREDLTFQFRFNNRLGDSNRGLALDIGGESVAVPLKNIGPVSAADNVAAQLPRDVHDATRARRPAQRHLDSHQACGDGSTVFGKPYDFVGTKTFGSVAGYEDYARSFIQDISIPGCSLPGRVFVGQRDEPFAVNLGKIFDLVNLVPVDGSAFPGGIMQDPANDIIADKNITTIALELPRNAWWARGNGVIGGWTTASVRKTRTANAPVGAAGVKRAPAAWVQVSRLSNPLVNEVVIGLPDKDAFNASEPRMDGAVRRPT